MIAPIFVLGRWDEAVSVGATLLARGPSLEVAAAAAFTAPIAAARGDEAMLARCVAVAAEGRDSSYIDFRLCAALVMARHAIERDAAEEALQLSTDVLRENSPEEFRQEAFALCIEAATALADDGAIAQLVEFVDLLPPAEATLLLRAGRARLVAERAHGSGDAEAAIRAEDEAISLLRYAGARPLLARALLERAGRRDDPEALQEARQIYSELGAIRWLAAIDEGLTARAG
jgi:hypothetical protein